MREGQMQYCHCRPQMQGVVVTMESSKSAFVCVCTALLFVYVYFSMLGTLHFGGSAFWTHRLLHCSHRHA